MDQINGIAFYHLGKWLDSIFLSVRMPVKANLGAWQAARTILDVLLAGNAKISLNVSRDAGLTLLSILDVILNSYAADNEFVLSEAQVWNFNNAWGVFESALELDLGRAPIFFVKSKGIYSTAALIANAENALVAEVIAAISEHAKRDLNEAGRCLAFELPTASGYHGLRAVEKVLREYYGAMSQ
jgi:hypothetical protein